MGDRANIVIRDSWPDDLGAKEAVFLYTHWAGSELPDLLRRGLAAGRGRWNDPQYLARILFQTMLDGDTGETGYGISTRLGDNEYDLIVLRGERLYLLTEADYQLSGFASLDQAPYLPFEDIPLNQPLTWKSLEWLLQEQSSGDPVIEG